MPRLGLCCVFRDQPIAFRTATAAAMSRLSRAGALDRLAEIASHNAAALDAALRFCDANGIGSFRIGSGVLPLRTHPKAGYIPSLLPNGRQIIRAFRDCGAFAADRNLRTLFHPDQFVVLNSPDPAVVESSVGELEHLAEVAGWAHADVLIVHGGGAYGDKSAALERFAAIAARLPDTVRSRLAVENDDRVFTPAELLPLCERTGLPFVYDAHHHRCLPDGLTVEAATAAAIETWHGREPLFHISSPLEGWSGPKPARHHDYIDPADFPAAWRDLPVTVEIEAKAKELAVLKLKADLDL
jgi:UV DNA damage endonuclease